MRALEILGLLAAGGTCGWGGRVALGLFAAYRWRRRNLKRFRSAVAHTEALVGGALEPAVTRATEALAELAPHRATEWGYTLRPGRRHLVRRGMFGGAGGLLLNDPHVALAFCGALLVRCEPILPGDERPYPDECRRCHATDLSGGLGPK